MEDKVLVSQCKRGSRDALRQIYEKYREDQLVLAIALLSETSAAEDVLHDVFVTFVQRLATFELTGSLKSYLATCVANRARNLNRAKSGKAAGLQEAVFADSEPNRPEQSIMCNEELRQLRAAMAQLPFEQREVIMLHMRGGVSFAEIAQSAGISVNTVKSRYRYGIDKLRSVLQSEAKK